MPNQNRKNDKRKEPDRNRRTSPPEPRTRGAQDSASIRRDERMIGAKRMPRKGDDELES